MQKLIFLILLALLGFGKVIFAEENNSQYQRLIIFGDSYSDNGNVYQLTHEKIPNKARYYQGRFSNGPAWCEYFASYFNIDPHDAQKFIDLAYGGAKILRPIKEKTRRKPAEIFIVPNLAEQINLFLKKRGAFTNSDLVVVFMGTNDYMPPFHARPRIFFRQRADQEVLQIDRLIQKGAKHIIVFNVRNLTYIPFIQHMNERRYFPLNLLNQYYRRYLLRSIDAFNRELVLDLNNRPQVFIYNIFKFDNTIFEKINAGGYRYSLDNQTHLLSEGSKPCYKNYKNNYQTVVGPICEDPTAYFFYDRIHTTAVVNYLLAKDVYEEFSQSH